MKLPLKVFVLSFCMSVCVTLILSKIFLVGREITSVFTTYECRLSADKIGYQALKKLVQASYDEEGRARESIGQKLTSTSTSSMAPSTTSPMTSSTTMTVFQVKAEEKIKNRLERLSRRIARSPHSNPHVVHNLQRTIFKLFQSL